MRTNYNAMTEAELLLAVKQNRYAILNIKNPSEAVQMAAIKHDVWAIRYFKNPSEAVCMAVVQQDGHAIKLIQNPSEAVQIAAVNQNSYAIGDIQNPSERLQVATVKSDPGAIHFLSSPIPDIVVSTLLIHHPHYPKTPKEILDRASEILENHRAGLGDVYTIGRSMAMTGDELSRTMIEWTESQVAIDIDAETPSAYPVP